MKYRIEHSYKGFRAFIEKEDDFGNITYIPIEKDLDGILSNDKYYVSKVDALNVCKHHKAIQKIKALPKQVYDFEL